MMINQEFQKNNTDQVYNYNWLIWYMLGTLKIQNLSPGYVLSHHAKINRFRTKLIELCLFKCDQITNKNWINYLYLYFFLCNISYFFTIFAILDIVNLITIFIAGRPAFYFSTTLWDNKGRHIQKIKTGLHKFKASIGATLAVFIWTRQGWMALTLRNNVWWKSFK